MIKEYNPFITISGCMGAGKTTLTYLLGEKFNWEICIEDVHDYIYIQDFFCDMERWSFHHQLQFMIQKAKQHKLISKRLKISCQDVGVYESYEIFSKKLFEDGLMSSRDFTTLTEFYMLVSGELAFPDLIVYLKAPLETLEERIKKRGRVFEPKITPVFLADLLERYARWIQNISFCPVLTVDTSKVNMEEATQSILKVLETITTNKKVCN